MTEQEAEEMTAYHARYISLRSLLDRAYREGLPLPDRLFCAEGAPDAIAVADMSAASERMDGRVIHQVTRDGWRIALEIRESDAVYRWAHTWDEIVHGRPGPQQDEDEPGTYVHGPAVLAANPGMGYIFGLPAEAAVAAPSPHVTEPGEVAAALREGMADFEAERDRAQAAADLPRPGGNENPTGPVHTGPGQPDLPGQPTVSEAEGAEPVNALPGEPDPTAVMEPLTEAIPAVPQDGES